LQPAALPEEIRDCDGGQQPSPVDGEKRTTADVDFEPIGRLASGTSAAHANCIRRRAIHLGAKFIEKVARKKKPAICLLGQSRALGWGLVETVPNVHVVGEN